MSTTNIEVETGALVQAEAGGKPQGCADDQNESGDSVPFTFASRQEILKYLQSGKPITMPTTPKKQKQGIDSVACSAGGSPLRAQLTTDWDADPVTPGQGPSTPKKSAAALTEAQAIAEVMEQLVELGLSKKGEGMEEMKSRLNVGKYVVGPTPGQMYVPDPDDFNADQIKAEEEEGEGVELFPDQAPLETNQSQEEAEEDAEEGSDDEEQAWWANDLFVVKKSSLAGLGAFAARDIKYGEVVLVESPVLWVNNWAVNGKYEDLCPEDKGLILSLHQFSWHENTHWMEKIRRANSFQTKDGVAIFSVASRFNHACRKAVNLLYTIKNDGRIVIWAKKDIRKGTELSICYGGMPDQLLLSYGFRCACGGCVPLTDRQADAIKNMSRANWAEPNFDGIKETTSAQK